jgi:hypothetical protein
LGERAETCPLCGASAAAELPEGGDRQRGIEALDKREPFAPEVRDADIGEKLKPEDLRKVIVELLSVSLGIILVMTLMIDFLLTGGLSWSRYSSIVLAVIWLASAIPLILWRHPWLVFSVLAPSLVLAVMLCLVPRMALFVNVALPITLLLEALVAASGTLASRQKVKGLNAVGIILTAIAIACLGIDSCLALYSSGRISFSWSIVVAISAIPVAGFFFYLHYRIINRASLKKLFRL